MTADTIDSPTAHDRLVAALGDTDYRFNADQLAWMMDLAAKLAYEAGFDAGYQARVAEENEVYRRDVVVTAEVRRGLHQAVDRADVRRRADRDARQPRPGDFLGGLPKPASEFPCPDAGRCSHRWEGDGD